MTGKGVAERKISSIRAGRRPRELGDIEGLAKSIEDRGLLSPLAILKNGDLLLGERRYAALMKLGWTKAPVRVVHDGGQAVDAMADEARIPDENKPMLPSEWVMLGMQLERLDAPRRTEMRRANAKGIGPGPVPVAERMHKRMATALGVAPTTYTRGRHVVITALSHRNPEIRRVAQEQRQMMDNGAGVSPAYRVVRALTREEWAKNRSSSRPAPLVGAVPQRRALKAAIASMGGVFDGLARIETIDPRIDVGEANQYLEDLAKYRRVLQRTINRLRQRTNSEGN
jgi:hypothetical protein